MFDLVALGETLIDFTPSGTNEQGMTLFARNPGGAPANVLAMNAILGGKTAFIGMVGQDAFGDFLESTMQKAGIDVSGLVRSKDAPTTLAFVQLDEKGDRSFSFYRKPGADVCLAPEDVDVDLLTGCRVFHFGAVSLTDEPARSATLFAAKEAKKAGALISFDPNYRPPLWESEGAARQAMTEALPLADILKVSDEEAALLTGTTAIEQAGRALLDAGAALVLITGGEKGAFFMTDNVMGAAPAFAVNAVDTTGSGDAFVGALLYRLRGLDREAIGALSREELTDAVTFASAAGGLTAEKKGAIPAMPGGAAIEECIKNTARLSELCLWK